MSSYLTNYQKRGAMLKECPNPIFPYISHHHLISFLPTPRCHISYSWSIFSWRVSVDWLSIIFCNVSTAMVNHPQNHQVYGCEKKPSTHGSMTLLYSPAPATLSEFENSQLHAVLNRLSSSASLKRLSTRIHTNPTSCLRHVLENRNKTSGYK